MSINVNGPWSGSVAYDATFPTTRASMITGGAWSSQQWEWFHTYCQPPLRLYARRRFPRYLEHAEDAYHELCEAIIRRPELTARKHDVHFRAMICKMYERRMQILLRDRSRWFGRMRRAAEYIRQRLAPTPSEVKRDIFCEKVALDDFLNHPDPQRELLFGVTAQRRAIWKAVFIDGKSQVEVARITGLSTSAVNVAVKKVNAYLKHLRDTYGDE